MQLEMKTVQKRRILSEIVSDNPIIERTMRHNKIKNWKIK